MLPYTRRVPLYERPRSFFEPLLRDAWLYPVGIAAYAGIPAVFGLYSDLGDGLTTLLLTCLLALFAAVPIHLTYAHLWPRLLANTHPLSPGALLFHAVVIYGGTRFGGYVAYRIFLAAPEPFASFPFERWGDAGLYMGLVVMTLVAALLIVLNSHRRRLHQLEVRELQAQHESLTAQLRALQARVHPHFLFNALNTLACLIEEDPRRAEKAVERLAELFRYTLGASRERRVSLAQELAATENFLELESLRFGPRMKAALHVDSSVPEARVPPLLLQPLVENAVLHGLPGHGGRVEVEVRCDGKRLLFTVDDDGPGPGASEHQGAGTALRDLRERLDLLYGGEAVLEVGRGPLGGCRARIVLPLEPAGPPEIEAS